LLAYSWEQDITPGWMEYDVDELEEELSEDVPLPGVTDLE
jgi:hypothetical protein